jgi:hypothetical protein
MKPDGFFQSVFPAVILIEVFVVIEHTGPPSTATSRELLASNMERTQHKLRAGGECRSILSDLSNAEVDDVLSQR